MHRLWSRGCKPSIRVLRAPGYAGFRFAQPVNDPGYQRELGFGVNKKEAEIKREKLFQIIRDLVKWENTNNEAVLNRAREAIWESWRETCHLNRNHP